MKYFYVSKDGNKISQTISQKDVDKYRRIVDQDNNHYLEELKLSVRIAKANLNFDKSNKYYQQQLINADVRLENELKLIKKSA
jgi:hypothetical protein